MIGRNAVSDQPDTPRHRSVRRRSSPAVMQSSKSPSSARDQGIPWCNSAVDLLYEFVKCPRITYMEDWDPEDVIHFSSVQDRQVAFQKSMTWVTPGIFQWGVDSSDRGTIIRFSGYHKCQNYQKNGFHHPTEG